MPLKKISLMFLLLGFLPVKGTPLIVAHRGASAVAPENTMVAFQEAWSQGADAIEGDFRLTKDGEIVAMHDATTKKTTGRNLVVAKTDWATLKKLDAGSWKGKKWNGEKIPLLSEVLLAMPKGKGIFIEVKCGPEIVPRLFETIAQSKVAMEQITVIAFNQEVIRAVKKREPKVKANWLSSFRKGKKGGYSPSIASVIKTLKEIGADGLGAQAVGKLATDLGTELRKHDLGYHVWTIDDTKLGRQFVKAGVQSVTTNVPAKMRGFLEITKAEKNLR